ncbi:uncharacterized protein LOC124172998 isoform X2 [Ischnura elegans]|uniref:uncharacterized protein LOC124172998 isoform X2 n=1 Tax=Ischnura elegans TaxID=197161 RepID=UPI001ED8BDD7|nr:uncharacterized protein LOC124172998 isoform X2 [Ischnura elegans]
MYTMESLKSELVAVKVEKVYVCRLCMVDREDCLNIFHTSVSCGVMIGTSIQDLLFLKVAEGDGLPEMVCRHCFTKLMDFREFKEMCEKSARWLRGESSIEAFTADVGEYVNHSERQTGSADCGEANEEFSEGAEVYVKCEPVEYGDEADSKGEMGVSESTGEQCNGDASDEEASRLTADSTLTSDPLALNNVDFAEAAAVFSESPEVTPVYLLRNPGIEFSPQTLSTSRNALKFSSSTQLEHTMDDFSLSLREKFKNLRNKSTKDILSSHEMLDRDPPLVSPVFLGEGTVKDFSSVSGDNLKARESDESVTLIKRPTGVSSFTFKRKSSSKSVGEASPQRYVSILRPPTKRRAFTKPSEQPSAISNERTAEVDARKDCGASDNVKKVDPVSGPIRILPFNLRRNLNRLLGESAFLLDPSTLPDNRIGEDFGDNCQRQDSPQTPFPDVKESVCIKRNSSSKLSAKPSSVKFPSVRASNRLRNRFAVSVE